MIQRKVFAVDIIHWQGFRLKDPSVEEIAVEQGLAVGIRVNSDKRKFLKRLFSKCQIFLSQGSKKKSTPSLNFHELHGIVTDFVAPAFVIQLAIVEGRYALAVTYPEMRGRGVTIYQSLGGAFKACYHLLYNYFDEVSIDLNPDSIKNAITFQPEHKQAGLQILNYFQETLNQKYPDNDVTVRIGQKGNTVTMEIETPDGETENYEKALEEYGLVVTGEKPVEEYLESPVDQMELKHQLQMANMQLEHKRDMITMKDQVISNQENTIDGLNQQIQKITGAYIKLSERLADIAEKAVESDDMQPVFTILDEELANTTVEELTQELEALKADKPTLWEAIQTHAYKIAEKAVYTQGSTELINLLTQV